MKYLSLFENFAHDTLEIGFACFAMAAEKADLLKQKSIGFIDQHRAGELPAHMHAYGLTQCCDDWAQQS
jgi:hypothetical protein